MSLDLFYLVGFISKSRVFKDLNGFFFSQKSKKTWLYSEKRNKTKQNEDSIRFDTLLIYMYCTFVYYLKWVVKLSIIRQIVFQIQLLITNVGHGITFHFVTTIDRLIRIKHYNNRKILIIPSLNKIQRWFSETHFPIKGHLTQLIQIILKQLILTQWNINK